MSKPNAPHLFAVFDGQGEFTTGVAGTLAEAEAAVLGKIRADYSEFDGCPAAYDADACSEFAVKMGDGMTWTIRPVRHDGGDELNPNHRQRVEAIARAMVGLQLPIQALDLDHLSTRERAAFNAAWNAASVGA